MKRKVNATQSNVAVKNKNETKKVIFSKKKKKELNYLTEEKDEDNGEAHSSNGHRGLAGAAPSNP